jgi:glycerol dehydrogenase
MLSIFCAPSRYVQGRDATDALGEQLDALGIGGTALIVASGAPRRMLSDTWERTLGAVDIGHVVHEFGGECSDEEIERGVGAAREAEATVIVGAGGGKVLDTGRAIAAELGLPVVDCPTVASSDAPCSLLSVLYTPEGEFQEYRFFKRNPDLVLVDTSVIAAAPVRLLVAGMGDALATWFEAETVINANAANQVGGRTTIAAGALARLCCDTLLADGEAAVAGTEAGVVTPALDRVIEANTLLSGLGFESGGLAVAHSVHNGLTTVDETHPYLHGEKVSFGLLAQLVLEGRPQDVIEGVLAFQTAVGLPVSLADVGLDDPSREVVLQIAERATAEGETAHNEPFEVTPAALADAIVAADALGRGWQSA